MRYWSIMDTLLSVVLVIISTLIVAWILLSDEEENG